MFCVSTAKNSVEACPFSGMHRCFRRAIHSNKARLSCMPQFPRRTYSRTTALKSKRKMNDGITEELDSLFDKYGKVVYVNSNQSPPVVEATDESESLSFAIAAAKVASDVKGVDIRVLYVKPLVYWTHFFVIATAFSNPQIDAMGSKIRDLAEQDFRRTAVGGDVKPNSWMLLDFGDVVVHLFLPEQRAYYNLEEFYGNATLVDLPFEV